MRKSSCRYINVQKVGYMILFISFCKPDALEHFFPLIETGFDIFRLMVMGIIVLLYVSKRKNIDKFVTASIIYSIILIVFSAINHRLVIGTFMQLGSIIAIILLTDLLLEKDLLLCFDIMLFPLEILIYLNLLCIILFPDGMYSITRGIYGWTANELWLLGMDNALTPIFLLAICISVLRSYYVKGCLKLTLRSLFLLTGCTLTVLVRWPATLLVVIFISINYLIFHRIVLRLSALNIWVYTAICVFFFIYIVLLRCQDKFAFILEHLLGKSLTFTGRTPIWDRTIAEISMHPLWGYGMLSPDDAWLIVGHSHAHNMYLNVLIRGGLLAFIPFIIMHLLSIFKLSKCGRNYLTDFISIIFFCMILAFQVEAYTNHLCFLVIYLAYRSDFIFSQYQLQKLSKNNGLQKHMRIRNEDHFIKKSCCY